MSSLFVIPLFSGLLAFVVGAYAVNLGENLAEGEKVGGRFVLVDAPMSLKALKLDLPTRKISGDSRGRFFGLRIDGNAK